MSLAQRCKSYVGDLPSSVFLLSFGQAINLTCLVASVTVAAIIGLKLAPNAALATLPYGLQTLAVLVWTYPVSMLMRRFGRRPIFMSAAFVLMGSGVIGFLAVQAGSFFFLCLGHVFLGCYSATANFYRFAAVDNLAQEIKPKAISLVVAGGLAAAIFGPLTANLMKDVGSFTEFAPVYASFILFGLLTLAMLMVWRPAPDNDSAAADNRQSSRKVPYIIAPITAIVCGAFGYFFMNLIMVQSSLTMNHHYSFAMNSHAIQMHVIGMFLPTLFAGYVIVKMGVRNAIAMGFGFLAACGLIVQLGIDYHFIYVGLIFLGVGWCFSYVGGSALLASCTPESARYRWQGINDFCIALGAALGAFLPAPMLQWVGWELTNLLVLPLSLIALLLLWQMPKAALAS